MLHALFIFPLFVLLSITYLLLSSNCLLRLSVLLKSSETEAFLGCTSTTMVSNMHTELCITSVFDRITYNVARLCAKSLFSPSLASSFYIVLHSARFTSRLPAICPSGRRSIQTITDCLSTLPLTSISVDPIPNPPPWLTPVPQTAFTHTSSSDSPLLRQQLSLEAIHTLDSASPISTPLTWMVPYSQKCVAAVPYSFPIFCHQRGIWWVDDCPSLPVPCLVSTVGFWMIFAYFANAN